MATINNSNITTVLFHPEYERIIPRLKSEEYQELKSSIAENGLYHPIIIHKEGFILDGHHRFKACCELGIEPKFDSKSFENVHTERIFVIDSNLARRQLEPYSRVELVLLKKEQHLKLGKQIMCEAGGKGNMIKWHYHRSAAQGQQSDAFAAEVKQGRETPNSSSCIVISSAPAKEESVFGFIENNKPDKGTNVSYSSFST
jgi:hypothetical protein